MIIDIDCGNSSLKWRIDDNAKVHRQLHNKQNYDFSYWRNLYPKRVRISSVMDNSFNKQLTDFWLHTADITVEFAYPQAKFGNLHCGYLNPTNLGVDRWLALVAAHSSWKEPTLIVDSGTATTIDALDMSSRHLGGYIIPGITSAQHNLLSTTTIDIPLSSPTMDSQLDFGNNTDHAISKGCLQMTLGLITQSITLLSRHCPHCKKLNLVLCGNATNLLLPHVKKLNYTDKSLSVQHCPHLVLDGLALALP